MVDIFYIYYPMVYYRCKLSDYVIVTVKRCFQRYFPCITTYPAKLLYETGVSGRLAAPETDTTSSRLKVKVVYLHTVIEFIGIQLYDSFI